MLELVSAAGIVCDIADGEKSCKIAPLTIKSSCAINSGTETPQTSWWYDAAKSFPA